VVDIAFRDCRAIVRYWGTAVCLVGMVAFRALQCAAAYASQVRPADHPPSAAANPCSPPVFLTAAMP
jgi:hypothetical protein